MGRFTYPAITTRQLAAVNNVTVGSTAFLDLPLGIRYKGLHLVYGGTTFTPALMDNIRVIANNKIIHNLTGSRRDGLNQFDGLPAASGKKDLYIPFHRIGMQDPLQEYMTYLETDHKCHQSPKGVKQLRLEIDIDAGASAPTLQVYAEFTNHDPHQALALLRAETWSENVATTGDFLHQHNYTGDPSRPYITRFGWWDTDAHITSFYFLKNQAQYRSQRTSALNEMIQTSCQPTKVTQSGVVIYDTAEQGDHHGKMHVENIADFQVHTVHTATNAALPVTVETLGTL